MHVYRAMHTARLLILIPDISGNSGEYMSVCSQNGISQTQLCVSTAMMQKLTVHQTNSFASRSNAYLQAKTIHGV